MISSNYAQSCASRGLAFFVVRCRLTTPSRKSDEADLEKVMNKTEAIIMNESTRLF
jgi:hypothetical protein